MATVSIIVPNYNYHRYLQQRLDSIFAQTFADYEVILLDDASTDDSCALLDYVNDPRVRHRVYNRNNSGSTFAQWKKGLELAQGEYVWIAESDDYADPRLLETLMTEIRRVEAKREGREGKESKEGARVTFAFCGSQQVDADGQVMSANWNHYTDHETHLYAGEAFVKRWLSFRNRVYNASAVVCRRDDAVACIDAVVKMRYAGDWLFWSLMAERGDVIEVRQELNYFRMHARKVTAESAHRAQAWLQELMLINEHLRQSAIYSTPQQTILTGHMIYRILRVGNMSLSDKKNCLQQSCKQWHISRLGAAMALLRFMLCKCGVSPHGLVYRQ